MIPIKHGKRLARRGSSAAARRLTIRLTMQATSRSRGCRTIRRLTPGRPDGPPARRRRRAASRLRFPAHGERAPRAVAAHPRHHRRLLDHRAGAPRHQLGGGLHRRLPDHSGDGPPRRPYPHLRRARLAVGGHHPAQPADRLAAGLDRAPRRIGLLLRRRRHDRRKLAERARHPREPRHRLFRLPDGQLRRLHRRSAHSRHRAADRFLLFRRRRHPLLPGDPADRPVVGGRPAPAEDHPPRHPPPLRQLAGGGGRLLPGRHGQRRLRHARPGLRPADRPADPRRRHADRRRAARRRADPVSAGVDFRPHRPPARPPRGCHRRIRHRRRHGALHPRMPPSSSASSSSSAR